MASSFNQFLNGKPTLDELCEHVRVGTKWYTLGVLLKLDTSKLDGIRIMNEDSSFKSLKMFELWLSSKPKAMRREIIETLQKPTIAENVIAEEYKEALVEMQKVVPNQILQKYSSQLVLSVKLVQMLYTEKVISNETFKELEQYSGGLLTDGPLRTLSSKISEDPGQLRVFGTVLLQSKETVQVAKDILKEYDQNFPEESSPQTQSDVTALATPIQNTTSTNAQSATTEVHFQPDYQYKFDQMKVTFGNFIDTVAPLIAKSIPSLQELKTYLRRCFRELKPQLSIAESFDDVMDLVEEKCTIINVACLEGIINHYKIEEAKVHVITYKSSVDTFCDEVKLNVCKNKLITGPSSLLKCQTIKFVLEWKTNERTFNEIRELLCKTFGDIADRVLVNEAKEGNSIIVTCYAPQHIMDILQMEAEKNLNLLIKLGLLKLEIGYHIIWDKCTRDKEVRGLMDEVRILEEKVISQQKEKDEEIAELKSSLKVYTSSMNREQDQSSTDTPLALTMKDLQEDPTLEQVHFMQQLLPRKLDDTISMKLLHSMMREGPQLTDTLSEKMKLLDRMSKAKILEIEKLTRYKEATDKVLIEKQEEIEMLQEKITLLSLQLMEREEKISQLMESMKVLQSKVIKFSDSEAHELLRDQIQHDDLQLSQNFEEILASKQQLSLDDKITQEPYDKVDDTSKLTSSDHETEDITTQKKDKVITQLISKDTNEGDTQQESLDDKELPRDTRSVEWTSYSVTLTSSTVAQCKKVIHQLKRQQHTTWNVVLIRLSPQSLLTVLTDINECQVRRLDIDNTHFDINCVSQLSQVVTYNKTMEELYLHSSPLLPNTYHLLTTAVAGNTIIKWLYLINDTNITDNDIPHLSHLIINNNKLEYLWLNKCPKITKFGIQQLQNVFVNNNSLKSLYVNGNYLR